MSRAQTKEDLLKDYETQYQKLNDLIATFTDEEQHNNFAFEDRDKNIRDVLIHLHEWQNMMIYWFTEGTLKGKIPFVPREGYTWKTIPEMNRMIWGMYQNCTLERAKELLNQTHYQIIELARSQTNEQLFTKSFYKWTKTSSLGAYFVSAGPSHYDWAIKKIKLYKKELKK